MFSDRVLAIFTLGQDGSFPVKKGKDFEPFFQGF